MLPSTTDRLAVREINELVLLNHMYKSVNKDEKTKLEDPQFIELD